MALLNVLAIYLLLVIACAIQCVAQPMALEVGVGAFRWLPLSSFRDVSGIPGPQSVTFNAADASTRTAVRLGADIVEVGRASIGIDLGYMSVAMSYTAKERAPIAVQGGGLYIATLQHSISAQMDVISLWPRVRYKPLSWLSLEASVPLSIVADPTYTQSMRFVDPVGLAFVDGRLEQITGRGRIVNVRMIVPSVAVSALAEIPIGSSDVVKLIPRIGYQQSLQSISGDGAYSIQGINTSLGVRVAFKRIDPTVEIAVPTRAPVPAAQEPIVEAPQQLMDSRVERDTLVELRTGIPQVMTDLVGVVIDTVYDNQQAYRRVRETYRTYVPKPPSVLRGSISLRFVDEDGTITNNARLSATRISSQRVVPVVPFIVFDSASRNIPERYVQLSTAAASQYQERTALTSDVHWHYQLLNVIGARMRAQRQSRCQLQTYAPNSDTTLGNARLRAVQQYLVTRFGVRESRIEIVASDKGLTDDTTSALAGSVVVSDPSGKLLRPIEGSVNYVEALLPTVRITPDAISEAGLRSWHVSINQGAVERYQTADSTADLQDVTVDLNDVMSADAAMKAPLSFVLHVQDNEGTITTSEPAILKLTSKALRPSERATPLRRQEILRIAGNAAMQQQPAPGTSQRVQLAPGWSVKGLVEPELVLYESGSKVYIQEERQP